MFLNSNEKFYNVFSSEIISLEKMQIFSLVVDKKMISGLWCESVQCYV